MADLFSILPGIVVSDNELLEAELIISQVLQAKYPDMDLREGTGARDMVVRPAATAAAMINKAAAFLFEQNNIPGITNTTQQAIVDKIMSNWFMTRRQGSNAIINARLFFARRKDVALSTDIFFSTDNTLKFFPMLSVSVPSANLTFDAFNNEYYFDVDLQAEQQGVDYNISSGSLLYFSNFDPFFLHAEINFLKSVAIPTETNLELIARTKDGISTRNLINTPSINSRMLEDFPLLKGTTPIGLGDAEMIRDQVYSYVPALTPPTVLVHIGGKVDVYTRVPLVNSVVQLTTDSTGKAQLGGPVYEFSRSSISGSAIADTVPFYTTRSVTSITRVSQTATVTTAVAHGFTTGDSITMSGANQVEYNGTFTIAGASGSTFTYTVSGSPTTPATGTITANKPIPYTVTNNYASTVTLTSLTSVGTVATATFNNHGYATDRWVLIAGATPVAYNGWRKITGVTANTFTFTFAGGTSPATGTITATATIPASDFGFSNRQVQTIDFTVTQASKTASFAIKSFQDLDGLQEYLDDSVRRVLCADLLARGYNTYLLTMNITAYNGPAPNSKTCSDIVTAYLAGLAPGEVFILADLVAKLSAGGITTIKTPITVTYRYFHRDLVPVQTGTITDFLDPIDRTALFMLEVLTTSNEIV